MKVAFRDVEGAQEIYQKLLNGKETEKLSTKDGVSIEDDSLIFTNEATEEITQALDLPEIIKAYLVSQQDLPLLKDTLKYMSTALKYEFSPGEIASINNKLGEVPDFLIKPEAQAQAIIDEYGMGEVIIPEQLISYARGPDKAVNVEEYDRLEADLHNIVEWGAGGPSHLEVGDSAERVPSNSESKDAGYIAVNQGGPSLDIPGGVKIESAAENIYDEFTYGFFDVMIEDAVIKGRDISAIREEFIKEMEPSSISHFLADYDINPGQKEEVKADPGKFFDENLKEKIETALEVAAQATYITVEAGEKAGPPARPPKDPAGTHPYVMIYMKRFTLI